MTGMLLHSIVFATRCARVQAEFHSAYPDTPEVMLSADEED